MGEHTFGNEARHVVPVPNREMLLEFCYSHEYVIANTRFQQDPDKQVTYYELQATPVDPITSESFAMIDFLLAPAERLSSVRKLRSDILACISSHHFPVLAQIRLVRDKGERPPRRARRDWKSLQHQHVKTAFLSNVRARTGELEGASNEEAADAWGTLRRNICGAIEDCIPAEARSRRRPWISGNTLQLIEQRSLARQSGDIGREKSLAREIKRSARRDRAAWLRDIAAQGNWGAIQKLRRGRK
eukprot:4314749-Pyramimonas_sp.AAC.1